MKTVTEGLPSIPVQRIRRPRHFPRPGRVLLTACLLLVAFASLAGFITFGVQMWLTHDSERGIYALGCIGLFVITRVWAAWYTHRMHCPLCHGLVLHEKRCRKHRDAKKIPLLSYRATAVLGLLFTGVFSCMYCGTLFRLKK